MCDSHAANEGPSPDRRRSYHLSTPLWGLGSENSGHNIDDSLEEDRLLLSHAFSRSGGPD